MNKVILKGYIANDIETNETKNDKKYSKFSIAVNRKFAKNEADFINCIAWNQSSEFISRFFKKGSEILVCGAIQINKYEKDGKTQYAATVVVDDVYFCGKKDSSSTDTKPTNNKNTGNTNNRNANNKPSNYSIDEDDDELPF